MLVLKNNLEVFKEISKSKFYAYAFKVETIDEIKAKINEIRTEHSKARHCLDCYYLSSSNLEAKEDGEPVNAMHKILSLIQKMGVHKILIVVVRYFGGVLLGASNLERTIINLVSELLSEENFQEEVIKKRYRFLCLNSYYSQIKKILLQGGITIQNLGFDTNKVTGEFFIDEVPENLTGYFMELEEIKKS